MVHVSLFTYTFDVLMVDVDGKSSYKLCLGESYDLLGSAMFMYRGLLNITLYNRVLK